MTIDEALALKDGEVVLLPAKVFTPPEGDNEGHRSFALPNGDSVSLDVAEMGDVKRAE